MESKEIRSFEFDINATESAERGKYIEGRAIVYNQRTNLGWYDEIIAPDALKDTDLRDVRLLVNHDTNMIPLARSRNNNANSTMFLEVVPEGMDISVWLDTEKNADASALYSAIERGDITGMSFMFQADGDRWEDLDSEKPTRHITSIARVFEVSAVTFPAYAQTSITARGLAESLESGKASLESARAAKREDERRRRLIKLLMEV